MEKTWAVAKGACNAVFSALQLTDRGRNLFFSGRFKRRFQKISCNAKVVSAEHCPCSSLKQKKYNEEKQEYLTQEMLKVPHEIS